MGRLYVVRHGQTQHNAESVLQGPRIDSELSELGRLQALALAAAFRDLDLDALFVSPLQRARQTAQAIIETRVGERLPLQVVPEFYEFDYGDMAGRPLEEIQEEVAHIFDAWQLGYVSERFPGGESAMLAQHRVRPMAKRLRDQAEEEDILVVGHGRINRILVSTLVGRRLEEMDSYPQSNAGITELSFDGDAVEVVRLDDTSHLDQNGPAAFS